MGEPVFAEASLERSRYSADQIDNFELPADWATQAMRHFQRLPSRLERQRQIDRIPAFAGTQRAGNLPTLERSVRLDIPALNNTNPFPNRNPATHTSRFVRNCLDRNHFECNCLDHSRFVHSYFDHSCLEHNRLDRSCYLGNCRMPASRWFQHRNPDWTNRRYTNWGRLNYDVFYVEGLTQTPDASRALGTDLSDMATAKDTSRADNIRMAGKFQRTDKIAEGTLGALDRVRKPGTSAESYTNLCLDAVDALGSRGRLWAPELARQTPGCLMPTPRLPPQLSGAFERTAVHLP